MLTAGARTRKARWQPRSAEHPHLAALAEEDRAALSGRPRKANAGQYESVLHQGQYEIVLHQAKYEIVLHQEHYEGVRESELSRPPPPPLRAGPSDADGCAPQGSA